MILTSPGGSVHLANFLVVGLVKGTSGGGSCHGRFGSDFGILHKIKVQISKKKRI